MRARRPGGADLARTPPVRPADTEGVAGVDLAYLDAGSGSLIVQAVVGGVAGTAVAARLYWRRLTGRLGRRQPADTRRRQPAESRRRQPADRD